jgi:hypothetical protein
MMTKIESLTLALDYLERHFFTRYLFPIKAGAKFPPLLKDNLDSNASNDPAQIKRWVEQFGPVNWGVAHRKSRLLIADVDTNPTKGKRGQATYDDLDLMFGWPDTETTTTPSGGFHKVYEGWEDANHPAHIMALGENGIGLAIDSPNYTLIPGCTFADGTSYVGNDVDAVRCPEWIYDTIKSSKTKARISNAGEVVVELDQPANIELAIDFLENDAVPAIEGSGGDFNTYKTCAYLKDLGISSVLAVDLLLEYYNPRCVPEWAREDLERKVDNAFAYTNLSKAGGKTAEADFDDDPPEANPPKMGTYNRKTKEYEFKNSLDPDTAAEDRAAAQAERAVLSPEQRERFLKLKELAKEWVYVAPLKSFIEKANVKTVWDRQMFDGKYNVVLGEKSTKSISDLLLRKRVGGIERFKDAAYKPGQPQRLGDEKFNVYIQSSVVPAEGDISWWNDHLEYLFPLEEDRVMVVNWMAWLLQNLAAKPKHALLLQGETQGTGKSFLVEMLGRIIDMRNVTNLNQSDLHGDFNGWAANSKLLIVEELRAIDKTEVSNKLHPLITQDVVSVNEKNVKRRDVESCFGLFAMTNHEAAINLDNSDRRYLVINTKAVPRYGKSTPASVAYYTNLYVNKLNDPVAIAAVAYELANWNCGEYSGAAAAPATSAKNMMIAAGKGELEQWMDDHRDEFPLNGRLIAVEDVSDIVPKRVENRTPRLSASIRSVLMQKFGGEELGQAVLANGKRPRLYAINGKGGILKNVLPKALGSLYEGDKQKAGKGQPLDDDAVEEFAQE